MIKRTIQYIMAMLLLAGCSDDLFEAPGGGLLPSDGELNLNFSVPEMADPKTRVNENTLEDVQMLVFSGGSLRQIEPLGTVTAGTTFPVTIKEELRRKGDLRFVFVSASPVTFNSGTGYDDILGMDVDQVTTTLTNQAGTDDYMVMTGKSDLQDLLMMNSVSMTRNAAKVTVKDEKTNNALPFEVYGAASKSPLFAGTNNTQGQPAAVGSYRDLKTDDRYVHPTQNTGRYENSAFIIVKVPYDKTEYYYRLNLHDKDGNTLDLQGNYHYDVVILDTPRSAGYATQEEAAKNPVSKSEGWYIIHDHAPVIFNMVSDGTRELGVSHEVRNPLTAANTTADLYVKVYSRNSSAEENDFSASNISFGESWVSVTNVAKVTEAEFIGSNGGGQINEENQDGSGNKVDKPDYNTTGTVYKVTVTFGETLNTGLLETECSVSWKGLTRVIPVVWDRNFDASKLYKNVRMKMLEGETEKFSTEDYFGFIRGEFDEKGNPTKSAQVWGATATANNGEARDLGLHFPIQYGEPTLWTYEYEIELNDLGENKEYSWSYHFEGDAAVNGKVALTPLEGTEGKLNGRGPKFKLTRTGEGWEYGVGELIIEVNGNAYSIPLYHTGFLHKDNLATTAKGIGLAKIAASAESREWTYYEVVSIENNHWLDRNLGAHSSEMYVETSSGTAYAGNPEAAGGYYRVAGYNKHHSPDMDETLCPPGYTYPTQHDFNAMRSSSNFYTGLVGSYYTASFTADTYSGGEKRKTVYFPKTLYLDANNSTVGESRAGYYWSSTAASGTEKEEIGAWLKCFNISGEATSFVNGEVYCSSASTAGNSTRTGEVNGFAMPVRCVSKGGGTASETQATSFFVKGATHVYFYTLEGNKPIAVTTWPGTSIGSYNTVDKIYNVLYESSVNTPDKLYVIFNYKDANGKIISMSKDLTDPTKARFTDATSPSDLTGWKVVGDDAPDFSRYGEATRTSNVIDVTETDQNGQAKEKYYWTCDFFINKGGFGTYAGNISMPTYRIYWIDDDNAGGYGPFKGMNVFFKAEDNFGDIAYKDNMYEDDNWHAFGWIKPYRYLDIPAFDWPDACPRLCLQGRWKDKSYDVNQPYVLKTSFKQETVDGNPNYYCYTLGNVNGSGSHADGKSGKPDGMVEPDPSQAELYRIYVKPDGESNNAFDAWYNDRSVVKSFYTSSGWTKEGDYYYFDFTSDIESFTLGWQMIYNAWIGDNGEVTTNNWDWCEQCETPSSFFTFEETVGRKCYTVTGKTTGHGGRPS